MYINYLAFRRARWHGAGVGAEARAVRCPCGGRLKRTLLCTATPCERANGILICRGSLPFKGPSVVARASEEGRWPTWPPFVRTAKASLTISFPS